MIVYCDTSLLMSRRTIDLDESAAMARTLGDTHGWSKRQTAFDLWHLAAAWTLGAGAFLTFDEASKRSVGRWLSAPAKGFIGAAGNSYN